MKAFIGEIGKVLKISRLDLIEKDILLHKILHLLSEDDLFRNNLSFKGGTCLIKSYLGYYRFSEDLDFTWRDRNSFNNMSSKKMRKLLSVMIDRIGKSFEAIGEVIGLDFTCDKANRKYVELGGSNKMVTFKMWYESSILEYHTFLKIQINFVEKLFFPTSDRTLRSLITDIVDNDITAFFPTEYESYSKNITFPVYDIREILCEKTRSILTRRGRKARDFVDMFQISKTFDIDLDELKSQMVEKTAFSLKIYKKYQENLRRKKEMLGSDDFFEWGAERELLLCEISEAEFYKFVERVILLLREIIEEI